MSQRQIHIDNPEILKKGLPGLHSKKINVVLKDNTVKFGMLVKADSQQLIIKNMRLKSVSIPIDHIFEIYSDKEA